MRRLALPAAVLLLAGCGGHRASAPACTLSFAQTPSPETGEHSVAVRSTCALRSNPSVGLGGLPFTFVSEGGPKGAHVVLFDKYRCDVRPRAVAREVRVDGVELRMKTSLMDWCPAQAVSTVVHVYLGGRHAPATWRGVLRDVYDGRFDRVWPCRALRDALARFPNGPTTSTLPLIVERAASPACDAAIAAVPERAPRFAVEEALGTPSSGGPRCLVWRWEPAGGSVDGARVCFAHGRATVVQRDVHG